MDMSFANILMAGGADKIVSGISEQIEAWVPAIVFVLGSIMFIFGIVGVGKNLMKAKNGASPGGNSIYIASLIVGSLLSVTGAGFNLIKGLSDKVVSDVKGWNTSDISSTIADAGGWVQTFAQPALTIIGAILVILSCVRIAKGLASDGRAQINWTANIAILCIGAVCMMGANALALLKKTRDKVVMPDANTIINGGGGGTTIVVDVMHLPFDEPIVISGLYELQ